MASQEATTFDIHAGHIKIEHDGLTYRIDEEGFSVVEDGQELFDLEEIVETINSETAATIDTPSAWT